MKEQAKHRVLVTGAHTTSALAIVRSLGAAGMSVAAAGELGRFNLASYSRYVCRVVTLPSAEEHPAAYFEELVRELQRGSYDVLIPTTDTTIAILRPHRQRIETLVRVALPPNDALEAAQDKQITIERARESDVAIPRTRIFRSLGELDLAADDLEYPCVVKPRFSCYWDGAGPIARGGVRYADSAQSLRDIFRSARLDPELFLVQELIHGDGLGVFALLEEGNARAVFAHRRLREANPTGGRASLAESIAPEDRVVAPALRLLHALRWTGVAMVEFKDPGAPAPPVVMEINGRFWGSLPLAIAAGVDFPLLLVQQLLGLDITPPGSYRYGVRCRHLKGDLSYLAATMKGRPRHWTGPFPKRLEALVAITPWPGRWRSYNLRATDPIPALREAGDFLLQEARSVARRLRPRSGERGNSGHMSIDCLLHVHSSFSYDSETDLADIARTARLHRIQCVLMSEHNNRMNPEQVSAFVRRCDELSDEQLLIVPGLELAYDANRVHLLAYGIRHFIDSTSAERTIRSLIDAVHDAGGLAVLAHPSHRRAFERLAPDDLSQLDGIEIWNVKNGNRFVPSASDLRLLRRVRTRGGRAFGFGGLDWHHLNKFLPFVLNVSAPALTKEAVFQALREGQFTVRGEYVCVPAVGDRRRIRLLAYEATSRALATTRRVGYRWQSALERRGVKIPKTLMAIARRVS